MPRNRLLMLAGAVVAALAVVIVVVVVASGGDSATSTSTTTAASAASAGDGATEATSTFAAVPQHGATLGKATAPVTLVVFEDPQCPYCKQWNIDTLPTVVRDYVRPGRVKVVYRGIPIISDNSLAGIAAAYAAGKQNKLWNMIEAQYERQGAERSGWITADLIKEAAREVGADPATVLRDAKSAAVATQIRQNVAEAQRYGINGTPTFGIQRQLGPLQPLQITGLEPSEFTAGLDAALR